MKTCIFVKAYAKGLIYIPKNAQGLIMQEDEKYYWINVHFHNQLLVPKEYVKEV